MGNPPGSKTVGFTARGEVLAAIDRMVADGSSVSAAVLSLVEAGLAGAPATSVPALPDLALVSDDYLIDELMGRLVAGSSALTAAAVARAEAAEAQLATIRQVLESVRPWA